MENSNNSKIPSTEWRQSAEYLNKQQLANRGEVKAIYETGEICFIHQAYNEAERWYMRAAKTGNPEAYYKLGVLCEENKIKNISDREDKIIKYYGISAILGCKEGQKKLADCYYKGMYGLEADQKLAIEWYEYSAAQNNIDSALILAKITDKYQYVKRAAEMGDAEAQYKCATVCAQKEGLNAGEIKSWLVEAANNGYLPAMLHAACMFEIEGTAAGNKKAFDLYYKAVTDHKNAGAAVELAKMITSRAEGIDRNIPLAKKLIDFAAMEKHPEGMYTLGCMYWTGEETADVKQDREKAWKLFKEAADKGHIKASYNTGIILNSKKESIQAKKYLEYAAKKGHNDAKFELAKTDWKIGSYDEAIKLYEELASASNETAQLTLGEIYRQGDHVQKSYKNAIEYYSMSPACKDNKTQLIIGQMYQSGGYGIDKNKTLAFEWNKKAAEQGNAEAANLVANTFRKGDGTNKDTAKALYWYEIAAQKNDIDAIEWLGYMYNNGDGLPDGKPDYEKAIYYRKKGVELGSATAKNNLAWSYYKGKGVKQDKKISFSLFLEAAKGGNLVSIEQVAEMYDNGEGTEKNSEESFKWYKVAADKRYKDTPFIVAEKYRSGQGTEKNETEALKYYEIGADNGHLKSKYYMGYMYLYGLGCQQNVEKAKEYFIEAAQDGDVESQYYVGEIFYVNEKQPEKAYEWYEKAALQDYLPAESKLATMYENGDGVLANYQKSLEWHEKAAKHNDLKSLEKVGFMFETGKGTRDDSPDYKMAASCYRRAVELGSDFAKERMGILYYQGQGVETDFKKAFELFSIVAKKEERPLSMLYVAKMLREGQGVEKNSKQSFEWFMKLSDKGSPMAMYETAEMLRTGEGVPRDTEKALEYYRKSAEIGYIKSCEWLGNEYSTGILVKKDTKIAEKYLEKAIKKRSLRAMVVLGLNYWQGNDVDEHNKAIRLFDYVIENDDGTIEKSTKGILLLYLGDAYKEGKCVDRDFEKAINYYEKCHETGNTDALVRMALMYKKGEGVPKDKRKYNVLMLLAAGMGNEYTILKTKLYK